MNLKELKELFRLVEKTDFTKVEITLGDINVLVERKGQPFEAFAPLPTLEVSEPPPVGGPKHTEEAKVLQKEVEETPGVFITSPFVGTFYAAPSPEKDAFVSLGQTVSKGDVVCIIEAMKLMNEIESDVSGKVVEIYVKNGHTVEYGEKLFKILP